MDDENEYLTNIELTGGHHHDADGMEIDESDQPTSRGSTSGATNANNAQTDAGDADTGVPAEHVQPTPGQAAVNNNGHIEQSAPGAPEGDESSSDSDGEEDDDESDSDSDDSDSDGEDDDEENESDPTLNQALPNHVVNGIPDGHGAGLPGNAAEGFFQGGNEGDETDDGDGDSAMSDLEEDGEPLDLDEAMDQGDPASDSEDESGLNWCDPCRKTIYPRYVRLRLKANRRKTAVRNWRQRYRTLLDKTQTVRQNNRYLITQRQQLRQQIDWQKNNIEELEGKLDRARHGIRRTDITWGAELQKLLTQGNGNGDDEPVLPYYPDIYALSCKEGNMSAALSVRAVGKLHPDLNLRAPTTAEKACQAQRTIARRNRNSAATATKVKPVTMGLIPGNNAAWFNDLPIGILIRILKCVLLFRDVPIHVISRLDPFYQPHTVPSTASGSPTYIRKFHIGTDPGRFAESIGSKVQRLKHVELLWTGSQELAYKKNDRHNFISKRTEPLTWLNECSRLRTLKVFVQETNKSYMRRKHETRGVIEYMKRKTTHQPDYRLNRSLRMIQGMDHVYCLRGMEQVVFFDYDVYLNDIKGQREENRSRKPVRDCDFILDINRRVRQCKHHTTRHLSRLEGLAPMVDGYDPSDDEWPVLREQFEVDWDTPVQPSRTVNEPTLPPSDDIVLNQSSGGDDDDGGPPGSGSAIRGNHDETRQGSPASSEDGSSSSSSGSDNGDDGDSAAGSNQYEGGGNTTGTTSNYASSSRSIDPNGIVETEYRRDLMDPKSSQRGDHKHHKEKAKSQNGRRVVRPSSPSQPIELDIPDEESPLGNGHEIHEASPGTAGSLFIDAAQNGGMQLSTTESSVGTVAWRESTADTDIYEAPTAATSAGASTNVAPLRSSSSDESDSLFVRSPEPDGQQPPQRSMDSLDQLVNYQQPTAWQGDTGTVLHRSSTDIEPKSEIDSKDDVMQGLKQKSSPIGTAIKSFGTAPQMEGSSAETAIVLDSESDEEGADVEMADTGDEDDGSDDDRDVSIECY